VVEGMQVVHHFPRTVGFEGASPSFYIGKIGGPVAVVRRLYYYGLWLVGFAGRGQTQQENFRFEISVEQIKNAFGKKLSSDAKEALMVPHGQFGRGRQSEVEREVSGTGKRPEGN
jgi:hypothetical protein